MKYNRSIGEANLQKIDGEGGQQVVDSLSLIAPDVSDYIIEFAFGEIYAREGLNLKQREMVTIASLLTQGGCEAQLEVHIHGSLNVGLSDLEIIEVFIQLIPYVGFPKVLNAITVAKKVFAQ